MSLKATLATLLAGTALASCSDNDAAPSNPGNYVVTVTSAANTAKADYLLTAGSLESGSVSIIGNGVEQDGTYRYYVTLNGKFFSMLYGQGNPGAVTAYNIKEGKLNKVTNFQTETVQAFAPVNDDLLLFKISRNITTPTSTWYKVNTNSLSITGDGAVNTLNLTRNGELAHFSWLKQVGTKVYAPYFSIKGANLLNSAGVEAKGTSFTTAYPDSSWIAVFNYADMKLEKVIRDNRASFIGRYFRDGLSVQENGDVYGFSSAVATAWTGAVTGTVAALSSTKPSAILRIKAGATEFDKSYYLNFESLSGGMNITNWYYLGNNIYLTRASTPAEKGAYTDGLNIGILDVAAGTYKPVTGLPAKADISTIAYNTYVPKDSKTGYLGVNLKDGTSYVYKVDASTLAATRGLKVDGGTITAVQYLAQ